MNNYNLMNDCDFRHLLDSISLESAINMSRTAHSKFLQHAWRLIIALKLESRYSNYNEKLRVINNNSSSINFDGYKPYDDATTYGIEKDSIIIRRSLAEFNNSVRQIVCNAIIKSGNEYAFMRRKPVRTEKRLVNTLGLVGGHLNANDPSIYCGLCREAQEEVSHLDLSKCIIKPLGYIKTDGEKETFNVSKEHLCALYLIEVCHDTKNMYSTSEGEELVWYKKNELVQMLTNASNHGQNGTVFDGWAYIAIEEFLKLERK